MISVLGIVLCLLAAKAVAQLWLEHLNEREVLRNSGSVPAAFRGIIDNETYRKAVEYTLAKGRFNRFELIYDAAILALVLVSGILPALFEWFMDRLGEGAVSQAAFIFTIGLLLSIPSMPLTWLEQFRLEERFGFNTMTAQTWWLDRLKGLLLSSALGFPLLWLVLKLVQWTGSAWWLWAWAIILGFQLLMVVLAPILIMPLFNKFTPLPEGSLRDRLLKLGERTGFHARSIQVMDGSKRSRHSNAFFTGFGQFRKIVLFDTLISQLEERELEAVLAHEIGHYKKRHIPKMLAGSAVGLLIGLFVIARLTDQAWFYGAFGFDANPGNLAPAFILFSLLSGLVTFWFSPLWNVLSRRFEYQADAYAAGTMREIQSLVGALRKLNEKNLSNLTPHPAYSGFYYSHPTLLERERSLKRLE
jgi:STE24 endopeptidase